MMSDTASPIFNTSGLRANVRVKVSLVVITLVGMLVIPSALCSAEQSSSRAIEQGNSGNNTSSTAKYQSAVGRYLEPGEAPDLAEERDTAKPNRSHPNNDTEAISGTFRASTQVEKRGERPRSGGIQTYGVVPGNR
jgi:hypothetical protein